MKYKVTFKGFVVDDTFSDKLQKYLQKLEGRFIHIAEDIPLLTIAIKKHEKHSFFSGRFTLSLFKKTIVAICEAHNEQELLYNGFDKLTREFEKYKGKHFKSLSTYPNHDSIRKMAETNF